MHDSLLHFIQTARESLPYETLWHDLQVLRRNGVQWCPASEGELREQLRALARDEWIVWRDGAVSATYKAETVTEQGKLF